MDTSNTQRYRNWDEQLFPNGVRQVLSSENDFALFPARIVHIMKKVPRCHTQRGTFYDGLSVFPAGAVPESPVSHRILAKKVMIAALKKSMNSEPTSGTIMNATGAGP